MDDVGIDRGGLDRPSTPGLIGDAIKQTSALLSAELQLMRALVAALVALRRLTAARLKPARAIRQIRDTSDMVKGLAS